MITDDLLNKTDLVKLRKMAMRVIDKIGDTNFYNQESINLKWINLHNLFRKGPKAKVFSDTDFQLIKNASEAARVSFSCLLGWVSREKFDIQEDINFHHLTKVLSRLIDREAFR